jgi:hypothetical protein
MSPSYLRRFPDVGVCVVVAAVDNFVCVGFVFTVSRRETEMSVVTSLHLEGEVVLLISCSHVDFATKIIRIPGVDNVLITCKIGV